MKSTVSRIKKKNWASGAIAGAVFTALTAPLLITGASANLDTAGFFVEAKNVSDPEISARSGMNLSFNEDEESPGESGSTSPQPLPPSEYTSGIFKFTTDYLDCEADYGAGSSGIYLDGIAEGTTMTSPSGKKIKVESGFNSTKEDGSWVINGGFSQFGTEFGSGSKCITSVTEWADTGTTDLTNAFSANLRVGSVVEPPATVTNMSRMFYAAENFNGDISGWDVSNVTNMISMFASAYRFNSDISNWDVSNVTNMRDMFNSANDFNQPIGKWGAKTGNVTDMGGMFLSNTNAEPSVSKFNQNLPWDTSNVTNMSNMFFNMGATTGNFKGDVSTWNTSKVKDMSYMFSNAKSFDGDLSTWNTENVTNMSGMFAYSTGFTGKGLEQWKTKSVTDMSHMFSGTTLFNGDLSNWNTEHVQDASFMFSNATGFEGKGLGRWNTNSLQSVDYMFNSASKVKGDLSGWNISSVQNCPSGFAKPSQEGFTPPNWKSVCG